MIVYILRNSINGKIYIGQTTVSLKQRWIWHCTDAYRSNAYICKAIVKYGKEAFTMETLVECQTKEELDELEKFLIILFDSCNEEIGYNLRDGGSRGKHSQITIEKLRIKSQQNAIRPEFIQKLKDAAKGKPPKSAEHRKALSIAHTGKTLSESHIQNLRSSHRGKVMQRSSVEKARTARTGKLRSQITKNNLLFAWKLRKERNWLEEQRKIEAY